MKFLLALGAAWWVVESYQVSFLEATCVFVIVSWVLR